MASQESGGVARRGRPRTLTEDRIVEATLELTAAARLQGVSMRALAGELDVPVMTLYNYVPNRDALVRLVIDHVLRPVQIPAPESGTWDERLKQLMRDARAATRAYPGLSLERAGVESAEGLRLAAGVMAILADGGFDAQASARAFATLFTFMLGQIDLDVESTEVADTAAAMFRSVAAATGMSSDELFEFGFDAVIVGLRSKL